MNSLGPSNRIPVEEKKETRSIPLFEKNKRINENQCREISDPAGNSEQFYFYQVMHL